MSDSDKIKKVFEECSVNILELRLFGACGFDDFDEAKENVELALVLEKVSAKDLETLAALKGKLNHVVAPLIFAKEELKGALDVFPIEFLNMKESGRSILGTDLLGQVAIPQDRLRLQLEREIRARVFLLRQAFLRTFHDKEMVWQLAGQLVDGIWPLLRAQVKLKGLAMPPKRLEVFSVVPSLKLNKFEVLATRVLKASGQEEIADADLEEVLFELEVWAQSVDAQ